MAFKEYSNYDFLYYKFGTTDASCNNVNLDDLIDSSCKSYGTTAIDVSLNDIIYQVTPTTSTDTSGINTIKEIAQEFTKISPYIFSYTSDNKLIVKSAKIKFEPTAETKAATAYYTLATKMTDLAAAYKSSSNEAIKTAAAAATAAAKAATDAATAAATAKDAAAKADTAAAAATTAATATTAADAAKEAAKAFDTTASTFLGYNEDGVNHELPYMFPNIIKTTYNNDDNKKVHEYNFDSSYNFGPVDIRALNANPYYEVTGISINTDKNTNVRYINVYSLIEHLNSKKIVFESTTVSYAPKLTINSNKLYYKFEYVSMYDKLKVDLMCQETSTLTDNKLTITIDSKVYTYTITNPNDISSKPDSNSDIIYDTSFRYWKTDDTTSKTKITHPTVSFDQKTITVVFNATKKAFVCNILPDFALEFKDKDSSPTLVYSASKYVKHDSKYHTLPKVVSSNSIGSDNYDTGCISAKQQRALCTNKSYADKLRALTTTHPGASERYDNIRGFTSMSILNIFNLGIGIVAAGVFIAQTYK